MSEDYTYQPVMTLAQAQARIAELEAWINAIPMGALVDYWYGSEADDDDGRRVEPIVCDWINSIHEQIMRNVYPGATPRRPSSEVQP